MRTILYLVVFCIWGINFVYSQDKSMVFKAAGTPHNPKVSIVWNRYYDSRALAILCKKISIHHPNLVKLTTIGKSYQGKQILCMTVTDFSKGKPDEKPGIFIQGNIHGNEIQGSEYALYLAWYLTECYNDNKFIQNLLSDKVFYIVPIINPDSRDYFIHKATDNGSPRFTLMPTDKDNDGKYNEDGFDDINKDGNISMMRRRNLYGVYKIDKNNPWKMIHLSGDSVINENGIEKAKYPNAEYYDYQIEGGIDNDGDGRLDEDGIVSKFILDAKIKDRFDPNRNWEWSWDTNLVENKRIANNSFTFPETRAIRDFFLNHPNITTGLSYHNSSGKLYPGTSVKNWESNSDVDSKEDIELYATIGKAGERLLPGYKYERTSSGLKGREIDWMFGARGVYSFLVEQMTSYLLFNKNHEHLGYEERMREINEEIESFSKQLLFDDSYLDWEEATHPVLGKVEVGGYKKNYYGLRLTPGFLMEAEAHRNMAFCLFLAKETPKLAIANISINHLSNGLKEVSAVIANDGFMPTHSGPDLKHNITLPDYIILETSAKIVSAALGNYEGEDDPILKEVKLKSNTIHLENIPGYSKIKVRWIINGEAKCTVRVKSIKGGVAMGRTSE